VRAGVAESVDGVWVAVADIGAVRVELEDAGDGDDVVEHEATKTHTSGRNLAGRCMRFALSDGFTLRRHAGAVVTRRPT
jgi:hypothetical protein